MTIVPLKKILILPAPCAHRFSPNLAFIPWFFFQSSSFFLHSFQLLVNMDKFAACCHMELINRTGRNKRQFNFYTNKDTFRIPPCKTPGWGPHRTQSLCECVCVVLKEVWTADLRWVLCRVPSALSLQGQLGDFSGVREVGAGGEGRVESRLKNKKTAQDLDLCSRQAKPNQVWISWTVRTAR